MSILANLPQVLLAGLVFGAGLPLLFALAMRAMAGKTEMKEDGTYVQIEKAGIIGQVVGWLLFALLGALVVVGVLWISQHFIYTTFNLDIFHTGGKA